MSRESSTNPKTRVTSISFEDDAPLPFYKKWWVWVFGLVLVLIAVTFLYLITNGLIFQNQAVPISPLAT